MTEYKHFCDRCGKEIKIYLNDENNIVEKSVQRIFNTIFKIPSLSKSKVTGTSIVCYDGVSINLCKDCVDSFKIWWSNNEDK